MTQLSRNRVFLVAIVFIGVLCVTPLVTSARVVELTFDDAPDGSGVAEGFGELKNANGLSSNDPTIPLVSARFLGSAHRSLIAEGRYGRAAVFSVGSDAIELSGGIPTTFPANRSVYTWVKLTDTSQGWILQIPNSFGVKLNNGRLETAVYNTTNSSYQTFSTGVTWPTDGKFHMLIINFDGSLVRIALDFVTTGSTITLPPMPPSRSPWLIGYQFQGMMDELLFDFGRVDDLMRFDYDPVYCGVDGSQISCLEEQIVTTPDEWPHPVPVRFKTVYDSLQCTPDTPCPLVVVVSGGDQCADDYPTPRGIRDYVRNGLVVAAVDPTCEATLDYELFPHETSQLIAVKNYLLAVDPLKSSPLSPLIRKGDYYATGYSHGANVVTEWSIREDDYPSRTFARSAVMYSGHCTFHNTWCPLHQEMFSRLAGISNPHDDEDPKVKELLANAPTLEIVTSHIAATREYGSSWGVDTSPDTPVCNADGSLSCYEEAIGFTYSSRRMRDAWHRNEPADRSTGYFFEYADQDCSHSGIGDEGLACTACFLKYGREGMETQCPVCLERSEGGASESCQFDDKVAPVRSNPQPSGILPVGTTQATLSLTTNEYATCKYSVAPVSYDTMTNMFSSTGGTAHTANISGLSDGTTFSYFVRCVDALGNKNPDNFSINFSVNSVPTISAFDPPRMFLDRPESFKVLGSNWNTSDDFRIRFKTQDSIRLGLTLRPQNQTFLEVQLTTEQLSSLSPGFHDIEIERVPSDGRIIVHPQGRKFLFTKTGDLWSPSGSDTDEEVRDGKVDTYDVSRLLSKWGSTDRLDLAEADINYGPDDVSRDKIDIYDANKLMINWTPPASEFAPQRLRRR